MDRGNCFSAKLSWKRKSDSESFRMGTEMEQTNGEHKAEAPRFHVRDGYLVASYDGKELSLGPADPAHEAMANHLGQVDFGG
jgi:hypothetical protein